MWMDEDEMEILIFCVCLYLFREYEGFTLDSMKQWILWDPLHHKAWHLILRLKCLWTDIWQSYYPGVFHLPLLPKRHRSQGSWPGRTVSACSMELLFCGLHFCLLAPVIPHIRILRRWSHIWLLWGSFYVEGSVEVEELIVFDRNGLCDSFAWCHLRHGDLNSQLRWNSRTIAGMLKGIKSCSKVKRTGQKVAKKELKEVMKFIPVFCQANNRWHMIIWCDLIHSVSDEHGNKGRNPDSTKWKASLLSFPLFYYFFKYNLPSFYIAIIIATPSPPPAPPLPPGRSNNVSKTVKTLMGKPTETAELS